LVNKSDVTVTTELQAFKPSVVYVGQHNSVCSRSLWNCFVCRREVSM